MSEELPVPGWTPDDTERWLKEFPLPVDFRWERVEKNSDGSRRVTPGAAVLPDYRISKGYGFWLRTTPYFPGLFEEIHDILQRVPEDQPISPEWLAAQLHERKRMRGQQVTFL